MRATAVVMMVLLGVGMAAAASDQTMTREQAIAALADKNNAESRLLGVAWLGDMGRMQDVPLLVEALRDPDAAVRAVAEQSLWQIWGRSGDPDVDAMFRHGVDQMNQQDFGEAIETFSQIIRKKPDFAEGWNKRATVRYLAGDHAGSVADCRETLVRNPNHFGALSGQGLCHLALGEHREAADLFRRALAVHPHLASARVNLRTAMSELVKWN